MAKDFGMTLKELQAEVFDKGVETLPATPEDAAQKGAAARRVRRRRRTTCRRTAPRALRQQAEGLPGIAGAGAQIGTALGKGRRLGFHERNPHPGTAGGGAVVGGVEG